MMGDISLWLVYTSEFCIKSTRSKVKQCLTLNFINQGNHSSKQLQAKKKKKKCAVKQTILDQLYQFILKTLTSYYFFYN